MDSRSIKLAMGILKRYISKNIIPNRVELLRQQLDSVNDYLPIANLNFPPARLLRVTINNRIPDIGNNRVQNIKYLKYPPAEKITRYGRCNMPKESILYGAFEWMTAEKEMHPALGDLITISEWALNEGETLQVCPIFYITETPDGSHNELSLRLKIEHSNYLNKHVKPELHDIMNEMMEFMALCFSKDVNPENHYDYFLSAYLTKLILSHPEVRLDALIYPSVQSHLAFSNMAVLPEVFDRKFHLVEVREMVVSSIGLGIMHRSTGTAKTHEAQTGQITWIKDQ